jgi:hypothetical protein
MSKGYLLFAVNSETTDYVKLAYACALSIKITQPEGFNNVSIVTHNAQSVREQYPIFEHVIEYSGPIGMDVRSRGYDYTPYDETVLLDSDMLFLNPVNHYWDIVKDMDLFISTSPKTYRGEQFKYGYYRRVFSDHQLPDVYSAWTYFKKSSIAQEFFNMVKLITDNPESFVKTMLPKSTMKTIPTDEALALSLVLLDLEGVALRDWECPSITHMKGMVQGWHTRNLEWTDKIRFTMNATGQIKLGVWQQKDILHYVNKKIINDNLISILEEAYEI